MENFPEKEVENQLERAIVQEVTSGNACLKEFRFTCVEPAS